MIISELNLPWFSFAIRVNRKGFDGNVLCSPLVPFFPDRSSTHCLIRWSRGNGMELEFLEWTLHNFLILFRLHNDDLLQKPDIFIFYILATLGNSSYLSEVELTFCFSKVPSPTTLSLSQSCVYVHIKLVVQFSLSHVTVLEVGTEITNNTSLRG